ncbi:MAG: serine/threonine-protein kinase [Kofleriaceae bacterium]
MAEAPGARRLVAEARRADWGGDQTDDEDRAYLQTRFTLFTKLMFTSFVILMVSLSVMYQVYPEYAPTDNELVFGGGAIGLVVMAVIWRGVLVRRTVTVEGLYGLDVVYAICIGAAFALAAVLAYPLRPAAYASLVYGVCTVFTRAIVVPSSGSRTLVTSIATFVPMFGAAVYLGVRTKQELPGPAFVGGMLVLSAVAVVLAVTGSKVIYGLRQKISEAMQLGHYKLGRQIGAGGMGVVYHAHHVILRRPTAVKLLLPDRVGAENLDRFEREVQIMSQLTHPNTVAVFDYGRNPDGVLYYAMEYLAGIDLEALVRNYGVLPCDRVVQILVQVCGALQEAHEANLIHRDIKPPNIILCERGGVPDVAKVVDFGLVQEITAEAGTNATTILGTPHYLAPEGVTDPAHVGPAADLYAVGAVGYYLLTGKRVFDGKTPREVCMQHVTQPPRPLADVTDRPIAPELAAVIMKCLAKRPEDRFASAGALADTLEAIVSAGDWSRDAARAWWREFRANQKKVPDPEAATLTMPVDLGSRS